MSADLQRQLETYYGSMVAEQMPIEPGEVADLVGAVQPVPRPTIGRSWFPILVVGAAAAAALLVIGVPLLLSTANDSAPPANEPSAPSTTAFTETSTIDQSTATTVAPTVETEPPVDLAVTPVTAAPAPVGPMVTVVGSGTIEWTYVPGVPGETPYTLSDLDPTVPVRVETNGSGYLMHEARFGGSNRVWTSPDGVEWQGSSPGLAVYEPSPVGAVGGYLLPADDPDCHEQGVDCFAYRSPDGKAWEKVPIAWDDIHDIANWFVNDLDDVINSHPPPIGMGGFHPVAVRFDERMVYFTANEVEGLFERSAEAGFRSLVVEDGDRSPAVFTMLESAPFAPQLGSNTACNIAALDGTALAMHPEPDPTGSGERYVLSSTTDGVEWIDVSALAKGTGGEYRQSMGGTAAGRDRCFGRLNSAWLIWGGPNEQVGVISTDTKVWHEIHLPDAHADFTIVKKGAAGAGLFLVGSDSGGTGYLLGRYMP